MRVVGNRRMKLIVDEMVCIILCSLLWGCERRELTYYMELCGIGRGKGGGCYVNHFPAGW